MVEFGELRKSVEKIFWNRDPFPVALNTLISAAPILLSFRRLGFLGAKETYSFVFPHMLFGIPLGPHTHFLLPPREAMSFIPNSAIVRQQESLC